MKTQKLLGAAVVAACAVFAGTAVASNVCQAPNGYIGQGSGADVDVNGVTTTWGAIGAAGFNTRSKVKGACEVTDLMFSPKARPRSKSFAVQETVTNGDQCALYKLTASVHWMLDRGDLYDAQLEAMEIVALVDYLGTYVSGGEAIKTAAQGVFDCITLQLPMTID